MFSLNWEKNETKLTAVKSEVDFYRHYEQIWFLPGSYEMIIFSSGQK